MRVSSDENEVVVAQFVEEWVVRVVEACRRFLYCGAFPKREHKLATKTFLFKTKINGHETIEENSR